MDVLNYKCNTCGAPFVFDNVTQMMICNSCGNKMSVQDFNNMNNVTQEPQESVYDWSQAKEAAIQDGQTAAIGEYNCPSCDAVIMGDGNTAATECPYCGNAVIIPSQLSQMYMPNYIIPFQLSKEDAKNALKNYYKGKFLLPRIFSSENRINKVAGVYVPFWMFDCDAHARITYSACKLRSWSDSEYDYVETSHFELYREGSIGFSKIPVDASVKMDDEYMEAIEPYNYEQLTTFNQAYLSGFLADKYDVGVDESITRANNRVENSTVSAFADTTNQYSNVIPTSTVINTDNAEIHYAFLPVWMLNTKFKDTMYKFAINGQTGKVVGKLPIDKSRAFLTAAAIFGVVLLLGQIFVFI